MSTKMKGIFKGIRYISQIFDDEQQTEEDMQIGLPTDVKHVAHVGWDGSDSAPGIAAPYDSKPDKDSPDVKWVSEDSKRAQKPKKSSQEKEQGKKASRRQSTDGNQLDASAKPKRAPREPSDAKAQDPDAPKKARRKKPEGMDQSRRRKNRSCGDVMVDSGSDSGLAGQKLGYQLSEDEEERQSRGHW